MKCLSISFIGNIAETPILAKPAHGSPKQYFRPIWPYNTCRYYLYSGITGAIIEAPTPTAENGSDVQISKLSESSSSAVWYPILQTDTK